MKTFFIIFLAILAAAAVIFGIEQALKVAQLQRQSPATSATAKGQNPFAEEERKDRYELLKADYRIQEKLPEVIAFFRDNQQLKPVDKFKRAEAARIERNLDAEAAKRKAEITRLTVESETRIAEFRGTTDEKTRNTLTEQLELAKQIEQMTKGKGVATAQAGLDEFEPSSIQATTHQDILKLCEELSEIVPKIIAAKADGSVANLVALQRQIFKSFDAILASEQAAEMETRYHVSELKAELMRIDREYNQKVLDLLSR